MKHGGARPNAGRKAKDGATGLQRKQVMLDQKSIYYYRQKGDGDLSAGIRIRANDVSSLCSTAKARD